MIAFTVHLLRAGGPASRSGEAVPAWAKRDAALMPEIC
jgi:hypothetical protein